MNNVKKIFSPLQICILEGFLGSNCEALDVWINKNPELLKVFLNLDSKPKKLFFVEFQKFMDQKEPKKRLAYNLINAITKHFKLRDKPTDEGQEVILTINRVLNEFSPLIYNNANRYGLTEKVKEIYREFVKFLEE